MALIALLLGRKKINIPKEDNAFFGKPDYSQYNLQTGVRCTNAKCVSTQKSETDFVKPDFKIVSREPLTLRCIYCEHEIHPLYIASSEWHQGKLIDKKYHSADSRWAKTIKPEYLVIFDTKTAAKSHGYKPSQYARARHQKNDE